jgi:SAM-dependent methyltransferase
MFIVEKKIKKPARIKKKKCYLCGNRSLVAFRMTGERLLIHCLSCDLIYADNPKTYSLYKDDERKFLKEYLEGEKLFGDYFEHKLNFLARQQKEYGKLLDVGCGAGIFMERARKRGWEVYGVDSSSSACNYSRKLGFKVKKSRFEDVVYNPARFDVITIFQTIEHLEDPVAVLKKAKGLLNPKGILVVTTPNRQSLLGKVLKRRWFGYFNKEHLYFFNKRSFQEVLRQAGFTNVNIRLSNGKLLSPEWVFTRLSDYYYGHKSRAKKLIDLTRPYLKYFNWIKVKEPLVDLIAVAQKEDED